MPARRKAKAERVSLRALARRRGVSLTAVQKAIRSGRLRKSVGHDARGPFIVNVALADREWATGATKPANGGGRGHAAAVGPRPAAGTLVEAQLRLADQRADSLQLANQRKRGEVLDAAEVERERFQLARTLRDRILNVPDRLGEVAPAVRARMRDELRLALGELANEAERE